MNNQTPPPQQPQMAPPPQQPQMAPPPQQPQMAPPPQFQYQQPYQQPYQYQQPWQQPQPPKRGRGWLIALIIAGVLLVGGGVALAIILLNKDKGSSEAPTTAVVDSTAVKGGDTDLVIDEDSTSTSGDQAGDEIDVDDNGGVGSDDTSSMSDEVADVKKRLDHFEYSSYDNSRFGFSANVPNFMAPGPESENGDGCAFYYHKLTLRVYASYNALDTNVKSEMKRRDSGAYERMMGDNWFAQSGTTDEGLKYREKAILRGDVWYTRRMEYPANYTSADSNLKQLIIGWEPV